MKKITVIMGDPDPKKHSTRFDAKTVESFEGIPEAEAKEFAPTFYIPSPFKSSKKLRVTIEEVE